MVQVKPSSAPLVSILIKEHKVFHRKIVCHSFFWCSAMMSSCEAVFGSRDLATDILLRVPTETLARCKCVCKDWLTVITTLFTDQKFRRSHTLRNHHTAAPGALLLCRNDFRLSSQIEIVPLRTSKSAARVVDLSFLKFPSISVVRSCNGLLLCSCGCFDYNTKARDYVVCNPITRDFITLNFPNPKFRHQPHSLFLGFDPLRSPHYEVVSISVHVAGTKYYEINVYSSKTNSWSNFGIRIKYPLYIHRGVYYDRAIHWYGYYIGEGSFYFDVDRCKCFRTRPLPIYLGNPSVVYFGGSGGDDEHLHLILTRSVASLEFDVLKLTEAKGRWSHKYHLNLNPLQLEFPEVRWDLREYAKPFYLLCQQGKEEKSMLVVLFVGGTAITYNPVNSTSGKLCEFKPNTRPMDALADSRTVAVFQYFPNLCSV